MENELRKIKLLDSHFRKLKKSEKERLLERIVKLNEEVGELCEAVLCEVDGNQRKKSRDTDFDSELADVLICVLLLGQSRKKNLLETLNSTLDKNLSRLGIKSK